MSREVSAQRAESANPPWGSKQSCGQLLPRESQPASQRARFLPKACAMPALSSLPPPTHHPCPHCLPHPLPPCILTACPREEALFPSRQKREQQPAHCKCPKIQSTGWQIPLRSQRRHSTQSLCGGSLLPSLCKTSKPKHHCFTFLFQSIFMLLKYERK